jgi:hypothetical protein
MFRAVTVMSLCATFLQAAAPADSAVFGVFKQADPRLAHFARLQRTGVTDELDVVIAMGSPAALPFEQVSWTWWSEERTIGLFLQEKARPDRVYSLEMKSGFPDCAARIERVTVTDSIISCEGEKSERYPNQKWVYDVRAKRLVRQFSYRPFAMSRSFPKAAGVVFVGSDTERLVAVEYKEDREPAFRVLSEADARPWTGRVDIAGDKAPPPAAIPPLRRMTSSPQRVLGV